VVIHMPPGHKLDASWQAVLDAKLPVKLERVERTTDPVDHDGEVGKLVVWITTADLPAQQGHAHRFPVCRPVAEVETKASPQVLAHELGHLLLLAHSPDAPHSVMAPIPGTELTTEQRYFMDLGARALKACRRLLRK
jgi:hypothetical protein